MLLLFLRAVGFGLGLSFADLCYRRIEEMAPNIMGDLLARALASLLLLVFPKLDSYNRNLVCFGFTAIPVPSS